MTPPAIHGEPKIIQDVKTNSVRLEVIVSGILLDKTKWFLGEKEIEPTETYNFSHHDEGGKKTLLRCEIKNFDKELAGSYKAKFYSNDGENSATFTVKAGNAPEFHDKPHIVQRDGGNIIVIKVRAKSHLEMTAEWFKDDKPLKTTDRIKMMTKQDDKDKDGFQFLLEIHGPVKEDQAKMENRLRLTTTIRLLDCLAATSIKINISYFIEGMIAKKTHDIGLNDGNNFCFEYTEARIENAMFEAKLGSALMLKRIVDAIKDLVTDAPFDCSETAMCLQAMDSSHVALVSLKMDVAMFESYRCDRTINLGLSLAGMARALKCANNEDTCLIRYEENDDSVLFLFEDTKRDKSQEVVVKMMDIDSEHLGIPEQDYSAVVCMPAAEFQKTCRDLAMFSDSLVITVTKAGIVFTGKGDTGSSTVTYAPSKNADEDEQQEDFLLQAVSVDIKEPVTVNFSIKYMNHFTKATGLSDRVRLSLCNSVPVVVEYGLSENGHLRFYLAPKIDDEDADMK